MMKHEELIWKYDFLKAVVLHTYLSYIHKKKYNDSKMLKKIMKGFIQIDENGERK